MKRIIYFLGSVYLAVGLIASSALIVAAGTIAESLTDSHLYASSLAYSNPVFLLLLSLFFVNILVSALRRWPFEKKHFPFLITHFGLLMIIAGVMIKNLFGIQGQMTLLEGTASDVLILPGTHSLHVELPGSAEQYPLDQLKKGLEIVHYAPHGKENYETWIKGNFAYLDGIQPFPVYAYNEITLQVSTRMKIPKDHADHWDLYAYFADDPLAVAKKVYLDGLTLRLTDRKTGTAHYEGPFRGEIDWQGEKAYLPEGITIPLTGEQALLNHPYSEVAADLLTTPKLLFVKDKAGDTHFFAFDAFGHFFSKTFPSASLDHYIAYDRGFSGYAVSAKIPFPHDRASREKGIFEQLANEGLPPLKLLQGHFGDYLAHLPIKLDWTQVSFRERKGCEWGAYLLTNIDQKKWPLATLLAHITDPVARMTALLQQVFLVADELPDPPIKASEEEMLAVFLRVYGVEPAALLEGGIALEELMSFECPLTVRHEPLEPPIKVEEQRPMIVVKTNSGYQTLLYDPHAQGLKWPSGGYLLSFRPRMQKIPHKVRLRDARLINYPQMDQAYSFESDLLITHQGLEVEKTISMNEVHETADGYRFYLSHIYPHEETSLQRIQLIVNRDPVKYWLTYPGGVIVALGIILLFSWKRK